MTSCVDCGGPIRRGAHEGPEHYAARDFCSHACRYRRRRLAIVEDVNALIDTETPDGVSRRLGYTNPRSLSRALYRAGRPDLARQFDDWALRRKEAA